MAIKIGCAGFPKADILAACAERFSFNVFTKTFDMEAIGRQVKVTAAGWVDKKAMLVAATCMTDRILPVVERVRSKYLVGKIVRAVYNVVQREVHGIYRRHFNAIDFHNKLACGPGTVGQAWKSKSPWMKFFLYTLAIVETNAYMAYRYFTNDLDISRCEWKEGYALRATHPIRPHAHGQGQR
jgi:hypothetical protein